MLILFTILIGLELKSIELAKGTITRMEEEEECICAGPVKHFNRVYNLELLHFFLFATEMA